MEYVEDNILQRKKKELRGGEIERKDNNKIKFKANKKKKKIHKYKKS